MPFLLNPSLISLLLISLPIPPTFQTNQYPGACYSAADNSAQGYYCTGNPSVSIKISPFSLKLVPLAVLCVALLPLALGALLVGMALAHSVFKEIPLV